MNQINCISSGLLPVQVSAAEESSPTDSLESIYMKKRGKKSIRQNYEENADDNRSSSCLDTYTVGGNPGPEPVETANDGNEDRESRPLYETRVYIVRAREHF